MLVKSGFIKSLEHRAWHLGMRGLLNSLVSSSFQANIRELDEINAAKNQSAKGLFIGNICIPIRKFSLTGHHEYYNYAIQDEVKLNEEQILTAVLENLKEQGIKAD